MLIKGLRNTGRENSRRSCHRFLGKLFQQELQSSLLRNFQRESKVQRNAEQHVGFTRQDFGPLRKILIQFINHIYKTVYNVQTA